MVETKTPRTLQPYELVGSVSNEAEYSRFNNWSNWGNGPTDPARTSKDITEAVA